MREIVKFLGVVSAVAGIVLLGYGLAFPFLVSSVSKDLNAIQATQVYTEGAYYALLGVGAFLFSILVTLSYPLPVERRQDQGAGQVPTYVGGSSASNATPNLNAIRPGQLGNFAPPSDAKK